MSHLTICDNNSHTVQPLHGFHRGHGSMRNGIPESTSGRLVGPSMAMSAPVLLRASLTFILHITEKWRQPPHG
jgi:hypothetical protein